MLSESSLRTKVSKIKPAVVKVVSIMGQNPDGSLIGSSGSGFLVCEDGVVVTNNHVIGNADPQSITVRFHNGIVKQCTQIMCRDQPRDFAVMRIEDGSYPKVDLGDYDDLAEGDSVYFCGYPLRSNFHTIHHGIVSSKFVERGVRIIQLDGSVNIGNSGGPLLGMNNKVVGIITAKAGGIDERLMSLSDFVKKAPTVFTLDWELSDGQVVKVDPTKTLADVIEIIHDYTNVGIGYAFSIEYAKSELARLRLI